MSQHNDDENDEIQEDCIEVTEDEADAVEDVEEEVMIEEGDEVEVEDDDGAAEVGDTDGMVEYDEETVVDDGEAVENPSSQPDLKTVDEDNEDHSYEEEVIEEQDEIIPMDADENMVAAVSSLEQEGEDRNDETAETGDFFVEEEVVADIERAASQRFLTTLHEDHEVIIDDDVVMEEFIEEIIFDDDEDDEDLELDGEDADDESSAWIDDGRDYTKNPDLIVPKSFRDQFASEDHGDGDGNNGDDEIENQDSFYLNIPDVEEVSSLEDNLSDVSEAEGSQTSISLVMEEVVEEGGESKTKLQPEKPPSAASVVKPLHDSADWDLGGLLMFGEEETEADDIVRTSGSRGGASHTARGKHTINRYAKLALQHNMPGKNLLFFGRRKELDRMREALGGINEPGVKNPRRLLWIYGSGGMGKTALADAFIREHVAPTLDGTQKDYFVGYGSFDERSLQAQKPYSALMDCLEAIVDQLMHDSTSAGDTWRDRIKEGLGKEVRLLMSLLPNIAELLELEEEVTKTASSFELATSRLFERMKFVVRRFLRIVCRHQKIVLFMDDLHWADEDSLRMIETILSTHALKNFFFIGCHRGVKSTHLLPGVKTKLASVCAADIMMTPLDQNSTIEIVVNYLKLLGPVAELQGMDKFSVWMTEKSSGNPFHLHQLLRYLVESGQIKQSGSVWKWDVEALLDQDIPSGAADLVAERIKKLPSETILVVKSAGFMGMRDFRLDLLYHSVQICALIDKGKGDGVSIDNEATLVRHVESAIERGLIELHSPGYYGFTHETVRKAATFLLPKSPTKQSFLHSRFASRLQRDADSTPDDARDKEDVMLLIADHMSLATEHIKNAYDREKLARTNLDLAESAIRKASFTSAVNRIEYGLSVLDHQTKWKNAYTLTLKLHLELARVQFCRGHFGASKVLVDALLANGKSERDKIGGYELTIWLSMARNQLDEAFRIVTVALEKVWGEVPSDDVENEVVKLRDQMDGKSDADLLMMPVISHQKTAAKLLFLTRLSEICWMRQDFLNQDLAALKLVELTIRYGSSKFASLAFALYGIALARRNLHREAFRFGHLAEMSADAESPLGAQAIAFHHYAISYWRRPFQVSLQPLQKSAEVAIDSNDMEHLSFRVGAFLSHAFATGSRLTIADALFRRFKEHAIAFRARTTWLATIPFRLILKLRGESLEPAERGFESPPDSRAVQYAIFFQMIHAVFMQDMKSADKLSNKLLLKPEGVWLPMRGFMEGLIATSLARASSGKIRVKHQRKAAKIIEVLGGWAKKGLKQVYHMANLVNVELRMLSDTKMEPAQSSALYDTAIAAAAKAGFIHHEALASERAGILFHLQNEEELATKYFTRACELYKQWGALAKVRHITDKFPHILDKKDSPSKKASFVYLEELDPFAVAESDDGSSLDFGESQIIHFNFNPAALSVPRASIRGRGRATIRGARAPATRGRTGRSAARGLRVKIPSERSVGRGGGGGRVVVRGRGRVPPPRGMGARTPGRGFSEASTEEKGEAESEEDEPGNGERKKEPRMGGLVKSLSWSKRKKNDDEKPINDDAKDAEETEVQELNQSVPSRGLARSLSWSKRKKTDKKRDGTSSNKSVDGALSAPRRGMVKSFSWSKRKKKSKDADGHDDNDTEKKDTDESTDDDPKKEAESPSGGDVTETELSKDVTTDHDGDDTAAEKREKDEATDNEPKRDLETLPAIHNDASKKPQRGDDEPRRDVEKPAAVGNEQEEKAKIADENNDVTAEKDRRGNESAHRKDEECKEGLVKPSAIKEKKKKVATAKTSAGSSAGSVLHLLPDESSRDAKKSFSSVNLDLDLWTSSEDEEEDEKSSSRKKGKSKFKDDASIQTAKSTKSAPHLGDDKKESSRTKEKRRKLKSSKSSSKREKDCSSDAQHDLTDLAPSRPRSLASGLDAQSDHGPRIGEGSSKLRKGVRKKKSTEDASKKKSNKKEGESSDNNDDLLAPITRPRSLASGLDIQSDHGPRREAGKIRKVVRRKSAVLKKKIKAKEPSSTDDASSKGVNEQDSTSNNDLSSKVLSEDSLSKDLSLEVLNEEPAPVHRTEFVNEDSGAPAVKADNKGNGEELSPSTPPPSTIKRKSKAKVAQDDEERNKKKERKVRRSVSAYNPGRPKTPTRSKSESAMLLDGNKAGGEEKASDKKVKKKSKSKGKQLELMDTNSKEATSDSVLHIAKDETQPISATAPDETEEASDEKPRKASPRRGGLMKRLSWSGKRKKSSKEDLGDVETDNGGEAADKTNDDDDPHADLKTKSSKKKSPLRGRLSKSLSWTGNKHRSKSKDSHIEMEDASEEEIEEEIHRRSKSFNLGSSVGKKLTKLKKGKKKDVTKSLESKTEDNEEEDEAKERKPRRSKSFSMGSGSSDGKKLTKVKSGKKEDVTATSGEGSKKVKKSSKVKRSSKETSEHLI